MIPLRVQVQGFMSYREEAELVFEGAPLWVLMGRNGAGKSAIFDAITYALYGAHRGGEQNAVALVNQAANALVVEFDFALGNEVYRIKRTLSRRGRMTVGVFQLHGSRIQAVPQTDSIKGFENWIETHISLDLRTFTASVLLQQGRSDALLQCKPKGRHEILSQLVDLSAYNRLCAKAEDRQKKCAQQADLHGHELRTLAPVEDTEIESRAAQIECAREDLKRAQDELEELAGWRVHAANWARLGVERVGIETALEEAGVLFSRADEIERNAARADDLKRVLPLLKSWLDSRERLTQTRDLAAQYKSAAEEWSAKLEASRVKLKHAEENYNALRTRERDVQNERNGAQRILLDLADQVRDLDELGRLQGEIQTLDQKIAEFAADLDHQLEQLREQVEALTELRGALPHLQSFAEARSLWTDAEANLAKVDSELAELDARGSALSDEKERLSGQVQAAAARADELKDQVTQARTLLKEAENSLNRLHEVEHKPKCIYCGQVLTAAHLETERTRLEQLQGKAQEVARHAQNEFNQAEARQQELVRDENGLVKREEELDGQVRLARQSRRDAERDQRGAERQARAALNALPPKYVNQIGTSLFESQYPSQVELEEMDLQVAQLKPLTKRRQEVERHAGTREKLFAQREPTARRWQQLQQDYSEERVREIRERHRAAREQQEAAHAELEGLEAEMQEADGECQSLGHAVSEAVEEERRANLNAQNEIVRAEELERALDERCNNLPDEWRAVAASLDGERFTELLAESSSLAHAETEREQLDTALREQGPRRERLVQIGRELEAIPAQAKVAPSELDEVERGARHKYDDADIALRKGSEAKQALELRRDRRRELERQSAEAAHQVQLYKELARLFGRDHLQRYLLQQAETGIVTNANRVLDRVSGGNLRLELRPERTRGQNKRGSRRGIKALDLVAYNRATGSAAIPVDLLSGSQRFRVAVSLALGIGQYSGNGSRPIESVIIDEGFGGLDKEGRREMIEQLHALTNVLKRIILVSHQDEFASAFPNRYTIELQDGSSHASLNEANDD